MIYKRGGLNPKELRLLSELDRRRQVRITIAEARQILGASAARALADMARKGMLDRVGRGVYVVRPLRAVGRPWSMSAFVAIEQALRGTPHYIGGLGALTVHRLTDQLHASVVDVFLTTRRPSRVLGNARVRFHWAPAAEMETGVARVLIEEIPVQFSDPEKTILDAINHASAFGGVTQGVRAADRAIDKINVDRLVAYALEFGSTSSIQRLGLLLERHGTPPDRLEPLALRVRNTKNIAAMITGPRRGPVNSKWRVSQNDLTDHGDRTSSYS